MGKPFTLEVNDFSGGLNTLDAPHALAGNECAILQNFDIVGRGVIQKRFGYDLVSSGGSAAKGVRGIRSWYRSGTTDEKYLVIFSNSNCYTITPSSTTWLQRGISGIFDDTNEKRVNSAVFANRVIFGNGDSSVRQMGEAKPFVRTTSGQTYTLATSINEGATHKYIDYGTVTAGYVATRLAVKVETIGTGDWTATLHDATNATLATSTITNGNLVDEQYVYFAFDYLSTGETMHVHLTSTVADGNVHTELTGDFSTVVSDGYWIFAGTLQSSAPRMSIFEPHPRLLFGAGDKDTPSVMYWCDLDDPTDWTSGISGSTPVSVNDGSKIRAIAVHNDTIVNFKDYAKYGLTETFDSEDSIVGFQQKEIRDKSDGTIATNSVVRTWEGIYFLGEKGFQKYGLQQDFPDRRTPSSLSFLITPTVNEIKRSQVDKVAGFEFDNKIMWCAPTFSSVNDRGYVLSKLFVNSPWTIYTGINFSCFDKFENSNGEREVYAGDEYQGSLYRFNKTFIDKRDLATADSGFGYNAKIRTKTFIPSYKNKFDSFLIRGAITKPCNFKVTLAVGGENGFHQETITYDESNIQWETVVDDGIIGQGIIGQVRVGGEVANTGSDVPMYSFLLEDYFTKYRKLNYGREIYMEIECSERAHGIRIDWITIKGEYVDGIIKKS